MKTKTQLPIDAIKDKILSSYESHTNIILKASPGSGKTTRVPQYLLEKNSKKIYILEPRRLAAKLAALQVAKELGETVGETIGYIFRYERAISEKTRIIFLTEGTFLKILSHNKYLEDTDLIILDEFHERHLSTDAALSFILKLQKEQRPDLKIVVMSATIETKNLETYFSQSKKTTTIELIADRFPLTLQFLPNITSLVKAPLPKKVYSTVLEIITKNLTGDILVFLPGMKEIRECQSILLNFCKEHDIVCLILHGDLNSSQQDEVLEASIYRKIILSTNIAESSVTIPGIRIVIDSGLQRESSYNFFSGLPEINVTKISKASATQRAGRSNREGEGHCFYLYAELDFDQRPYLQKPEILKSDLSELYLMSLDLFKTSIDQLPWFEAPPHKALKNSYDLLFSINALETLDGVTNITPVGKQIIKFPLHPRLGRMLATAENISSMAFKETLHFLSDFLQEKNKERFINTLTALSKEFGTSKTKCIEEIILSGFPDRVARSRGEKYFDVITQNGETLKISSQIGHDFDPHHPLWVVLDLNHKGEVEKCVPIEEEWLYDLTPFRIEQEDHYFWDEKKEQVLKNERTTLGKIILSERKLQPDKNNPKTEEIIRPIVFNFIQSLYKTQEYERLLTLNRILNKVDLTLINNNEFTTYLKNQNHFNSEDRELFTQYFFSRLKEMIDPDNVYHLEIDLPFQIQLSDRRKIPIVYDHTQDPSIESYIQDFYGLTQTPILAKGKIPLTLKLLGPHKRAIQVTQDLSSFWRKTYPQMFKELTREYPRHHWPLAPENALPILLKRQLPGQ